MLVTTLNAHKTRKTGVKDQGHTSSDCTVLPSTVGTSSALGTAPCILHICNTIFTLVLYQEPTLLYRGTCLYDTYHTSQNNILVKCSPAKALSAVNHEATKVRLADAAYGVKVSTGAVVLGHVATQPKTAAQCFFTMLNTCTSS